MKSTKLLTADHEIILRALHVLDEMVTAYQRLYEVLSGKDQNPKFAHLSAADRRAVLEILRDTKPGLPDYWDSPASVHPRISGF